MRAAGGGGQGDACHLPTSHQSIRPSGHRWFFLTQAALEGQTACHGHQRGNSRTKSPSSNPGSSGKRRTRRPLACTDVSGSQREEQAALPGAGQGGLHPGCSLSRVLMGGQAHDGREEGMLGPQPAGQQYPQHRWGVQNEPAQQVEGGGGTWRSAGGAGAPNRRGAHGATTRTVFFTPTAGRIRCPRKTSWSPPYCENRVFTNRDGVRMRSVLKISVGPKPNDRCPYKKEFRDRDTGYENGG